jgi:hypothetical protein
MTAHTDTDFPATAAPGATIGGVGGLSPTGGWLSFYQTLPSDAVPHEIRFRHLNPFTGGFTTSFPLSQGHLDWGTWIDNVTPINLTQITPIEGLGGYSVVLDALDYNRGAAVPIAPVASAYVLTPAEFAALVPTTPYSISGAIDVPGSLTNLLDSGIVLASHGGMITTAISAAAQMANGGSYTIPGLPGGFAYAFYGVEAFGWASSQPVSKRAISVPVVADLRSGNATNVDLTMVPLF